MAERIRTALAAIAVKSVQQQVIRALSDAGVELLSMETGAGAALRGLQRRQPDLLIADMELPLMEGSEFVLRAVHSREFPRPAAILLHHAHFLLPRQAELEALGVRILNKPLDSAVLSRAIAEIESAPPRFPSEERAHAKRLLDALGVPEHLGRQCLEAAILLCTADPRMQRSLAGRLYPAVGRLCGVSAAQAERAMRHVIDLAWQSNQFENQYRIFADTVDAKRGQPTCGEMISRLSDILRLEG